MILPPLAGYSVYGLIRGRQYTPQLGFGTGIWLRLSSRPQYASAQVARASSWLWSHTCVTPPPSPRNICSRHTILYAVNQRIGLFAPLLGTIVPWAHAELFTTGVSSSIQLPDSSAEVSNRVCSESLDPFSALPRSHRSFGSSAIFPRIFQLEDL